MARVDLRCTSCGYHFYVSDAQFAKPEGVKCPSCLAPVGVNGPVEGGPGPKQARALEAAPDTAGQKMKLWIGIGAGVFLVAVVAAVVLFRGSPPPPAVTETPPPKRPTPTPKKEKPKPPARPDQKTTTAPRTDPAPTAVSPETIPASPEPAPVSPANPVQSTAPPIPGDLLKSIREELLTLKEWHLNLAVPAADRRRFDMLVAAGKGGEPDAEFLKSVLNGQAYRAVKEEAMGIRESLARLEKEGLEGLPVDKVTKKDGSELHGRILEETETSVRMERKIAGGSTGEITLQKSELKEILKGKGVGTEFKTRWETAKKGGAPLLVGLLAWCKENALSMQAALAAYAILVDDPGRAEARLQADLKDDPVARMLEAEKQGGFITYEGRRWLPSELKAKLLRDNYFLVDRRWMSKKPRLISVPGLFSYEKQNVKQVQISGTLAHDESVIFNVAQGQEKIESKQVRRFYAAGLMMVTSTREQSEPPGDANLITIEEHPNPKPGADLQGTVSINVPLNAPILEATVMTSAEVKSGGSITVYQIVNGLRIELYKCEAKEDKPHKLHDKIRGKTEVQLVAEISGIARYGKKSETKRAMPSKKDNKSVVVRGLDITYDRLIPEYSAVLFPSKELTTEVFRLTATVGEPAPVLDKLFENAQGVLEK